MPKAKKTKYGKWRCQIYVGDKIVDGKRKQIVKSFSAPTKAKAELLAAEYKESHKKKSTEDMTLFDAVDKYIDMRDRTLSPSTIRSYRSMKRGILAELGDIRIADLDSATVQTWINHHAYDRTAKTLKNVTSFLISAAKCVDPSFEIAVTLPTRARKRTHIPTRAEVDALCASATNDNLRKAILLAAFCSLRRSEACALTEDDIDYERARIYVDKAMVESDGGFVLKPYPKTEESNRSVPAPPQVLEIMRSGPITCTPNAISRAFEKTVKRAGLPHIRYHDLRHFFASYLHAQGIPDVYIEKFGGWRQGSNVMRRIYREAIDDEERRNAERMIELFSENVSTDVSAPTNIVSIYAGSRPFMRGFKSRCPDADGTHKESRE